MQFPCACCATLPRPRIQVKGIFIVLPRAVTSGFFSPSCLCHLVPQAFSLAQISGKGAKWCPGRTREECRKGHLEGLLQGLGDFIGPLPWTLAEVLFSQTVALCDYIVESGTLTSVSSQKVSLI